MTEEVPEGGFDCTALTDYYAAAQDELDLRAGALYTVIQTSPSGWWYAEDEDGIEGWVPSNYLVRLEDCSDDDDFIDDSDYSDSDNSSEDLDDEFDQEEKMKIKQKEAKHKKALKHVRQITIGVGDNEEEENEKLKQTMKESQANMRNKQKLQKRHSQKMLELEQEKKMQELQKDLGRISGSNTPVTSPLSKNSRITATSLTSKNSKGHRVSSPYEVTNNNNNSLTNKHTSPQKSYSQDNTSKKYNNYNNNNYSQSMPQQPIKIKPKPYIPNKSKQQTSQNNSNDDYNKYANYEHRRNKEESNLHLRQQEEKIRKEKERKRREEEKLKKQREEEKRKEKDRKRKEKEKKRKEHQKKKAQKVAKERYNNLTDEQKENLPKMTTISSNTNDNFKNNKNNRIETWDLDTILKYLVSCADGNNQFELRAVLGYLPSLAIKNPKMREYILSRNGLNVVLNVLRNSTNDVAMSESCCKVLTVLCEGNLSRKYPAEKNGVYYLTVAIKNSFKNPRFCYAAYNCICNFTRGNEMHRNYILTDEHNREIVSYIIEGMQKFRYEEEVDKNYHCEQVQIAACLALQNLAVDKLGQRIIGQCEGVEAVLGGFIAHIDKNHVVAAALGTLINLCALPENSKTFINEDGIEHLDTLLQNEDVPLKSRETSAKILHNIANSPLTAPLLANNDSTIGVLLSLMLTSDFGTGMYEKVLKLINTLLIRLAHKKNLQLSVLKSLMVSQLLDNLDEALEFDYESLLDENKYSKNHINNQKNLTNFIFKEISTTILFYIQSKNNQLLYDVIQNKLLPTKLIAPCVDYPTPQLLYNTMSIFFALFDNEDYQLLCIQEGCPYLLYGTDWYVTPNISDNAIKLGCGSMIKLLSKFSIHKDEWDLLQYSQSIKDFIEWIERCKPHIKNLAQALSVNKRLKLLKDSAN